MFPAPPAPALVEISEGSLRYEDVIQDGRLLALALPPTLSYLWRGVLAKHPGAKGAAQAGVIPILTRLTFAVNEVSVRVDRPIETRSQFELARETDAAGAVTRLFLNVWHEVHGLAGRITPRTPIGPLTLAGQIFAEHTFTRPFAPREQRRVTSLPGGGYPAVPEAVYAAPAMTTAGDAPDGATWLDELAPDPCEVVFTLDHSDSNQHVNSLVYVRVFLEALYRRLAAAGKPVIVTARAVDIAYRKPCFAGDRVRVQLRLFEHAGVLGAAGFIATEDHKPRCYVRATVAP
ncbi:MAG: hypothetical protein ABI867_23065 [Kofleriaceae bacterium]